jgi:AcrR family transcriptional regulator
MRQRQTLATKNAIICAAQALFSSHGYAETGVRDIARVAGVNQALIARYFGSKIELFAAALEASLDTSLFTGQRREEFGERIAEHFCKIKPSAAHVVPLLIFAAGDSVARQVALKLLTHHVVQPLKTTFGGPQAAERAAQFLAVVTGFFVYRLMLPVDTIGSHPTPAMQRWLARTLQDIVDRPADSPPLEPDGFGRNRSEG